MTLRYCPRCHKPAYRILTILPEPILDYEMLEGMDDSDIETLMGGSAMMKVLAAPNWNVALVCSAQSSSISFGCPWCKKGKLTILEAKGG